MLTFTPSTILGRAWILAIFIFILPPHAGAQLADCSEIFISEYIVGSGKNTAIEFYNPTSEFLALADYVVEIYHDGSNAPILVELAGVIPPLGTHVLAHPDADSALTHLANQLSTLFLPDGNDAIRLFRGSIDLDRIGKIGTDPGASGWQVILPWNSTANLQNVGMVRLSNVLHGESNWTTSNSQWRLYPPNDYDNLGSHGNRCSGAPEVNFLMAQGSCLEDNCGTVGIGVSVNQQPGQGMPIFVSLDDATYTTGPAAAVGVDYQSATASPPLTFDDISPTFQSIGIPVIGDSDIEPDEGFRITLDVTGNGFPGPQYWHEEIILNDDMVSASEPKYGNLGFTATQHHKNNSLAICFQNTERIIVVDLIDLSGKTAVQNLHPFTRLLYLDISNVPSGIYLIRAQSSIGNHGVRRIVIH